MTYEGRNGTVVSPTTNPHRNGFGVQLQKKRQKRRISEAEEEMGKTKEVNFPQNQLFTRITLPKFCLKYFCAVAHVR